ncbi:Protein NRT1/ PTR FAMILY 5.9 [Capsicum annuum]|uniref:Protein NRT1/ PTR FAMILY 5.9 n=1 Tax=Capsicum annuum TaxID=4072 RepID=A0A1U8FYG7_CAPAN|nr:protein NRT1/ PTR FAMILY 5.8 [Capsicum annuum]XP_016561483.1 protein NRT1/ PTR FAMILY 5.8 [Capsicum annuum]XP_047263519.1 protein NRT1/ PTR FAMILY 5.8 [Capsicum annuum]KAF3617929.1 Protein NRT1/ PTR FAMILY 5.9 [Capsicum annuum]PHT91789.1 Protein NRT1/ PTR FAMILY 5.9 [Capsicum annuum]
MAGGQSRRNLNKPCILLIVIAGMERFSFKGVASNLVTYLTDVAKMSNSAAAKMVNNWCGVTSMLPLLVAPLADSYLDRYTTVLASSSLYFAGLLALTSLALQWPWTSVEKSGFSSSLSWSLHLISLGQAGYNPSLQAFAADQLDDQDELPCTKNDQSTKKKSAFFHWWYFGICCGSLLGVSVMSYIQDTLGWGLGFAIPCIAMVVSIVVFRFGNRFYTHNNDGEVIHIRSLGVHIVKAIRAATSRFTCGEIAGPESNKSKAVEIELESKPLCQQDSDGMEGAEDKKSENGIVEIRKVVLPLLPVWIMLLMFAVIFQQPATFFTKQGMTMKRNIGSNFQIPPAALQSSITISIILLMPLYDTVFIPFIRVLTRNEKGITVMQRMGIGMFLSVIAMIIAAVTERKRLDIARNIGASISEALPMSIFWLLPQYILLGISDIFTVVGMQEFFYSEVPTNMRTLGIALYTSVFGCGSFFSSFLITVIEHLTSSIGEKQNWFADDMSKARLDNYYWFLALSSAASFLMFMVFCQFYRRRTVN